MQGLDRFGRFVNRRELAALADRLEDGETVLAAIEATHAGKRGVLAATERRVLFVRRTWLGARSVGWTHRQLGGMTRQAGVDDAVLRLRVPDGMAEFVARKAEAQAFEDALAARPRLPGEPVEFIPESDRRVRLERLDRMLERGSITRSEYERSKRAIASEATSE
jgi:hypothetical protein